MQNSRAINWPLNLESAALLRLRAVKSKKMRLSFKTKLIRTRKGSRSCVLLRNLKGGQRSTIEGHQRMNDDLFNE